MAKQQPVSAITALPLSPQEDRRARTIRYVLAMSLRVFCILMCFFVQGWWLLVFAVGAIVLPYLAVVLANVGHVPGGVVLRPGGLESIRDPQQPRQRPVVPDEDAAPDTAGSSDAGARFDDRASGRADDMGDAASR